MKKKKIDKKILLLDIEKILTDRIIKAIILIDSERGRAEITLQKVKQILEGNKK